MNSIYPSGIALPRLVLNLLGALLFCSLVGCATMENPDPLESVNRPIHQFNDAIDRKALKPTAQFYRDITPDPFRKGVNNFFDNINMPYSAVNNILQWQWGRAGKDISRFVVNSTIGVLGLFDVAGDYFKIYSSTEDFGQTLGAWGVGTGAYLVLPLMGPSNVRDTATRFGVDAQYNIPARWVSDAVGTGGGYYALTVFQAIRARERLLDIDGVASGMSLDKYVLYRTITTQARLSAVYNGKPPMVKKDEDESWLDEK